MFVVLCSLNLTHMCLCVSLMYACIYMCVCVQMIETAIWHESTDVLAAFGDRKLHFWYYPFACFLDKDLVPATKTVIDAAYVCVRVCVCVCVCVCVFCVCERESTIIIYMYMLCLCHSHELIIGLYCNNTDHTHTRKHATQHSHTTTCLCVFSLSLCHYSAFGRHPRFISFSRSLCTLRCQDGALQSASISHFSELLHQYVNRSHWEKATKLCRFVQVS